MLSTSGRIKQRHRNGDNRIGECLQAFGAEQRPRIRGRRVGRYAANVSAQTSGKPGNLPDQIANFGRPTNARNIAGLVPPGVGRLSTA
ncbi:MAG: hypothetical protein J2P23_15395, partial [Microlunatus sp.]|nr:hypothetical protein [Microlunatus sp.]